MSCLLFKSVSTHDDDNFDKYVADNIDDTIDDDIDDNIDYGANNDNVDDDVAIVVIVLRIDIILHYHIIKGDAGCIHNCGDDDDDDAHLFV